MDVTNLENFQTSVVSDYRDHHSKNFVNVSSNPLGLGVRFNLLNRKLRSKVKEIDFERNKKNHAKLFNLQINNLLIEH